MPIRAWIVFALAAATPVAEGRPLLVFRGQTVMNEDVYRAVVDLPANSKATDGLARRVKSRIIDFLRRAGYELATAKVEVVDDQIVVNLDEGRLDKVRFKGQGAFDTLRLKLELKLPNHVFNRPQLERQLEELSREYEIKTYDYRLVPVEGHESGEEDSELLLPDPIQNLDLLPPGRPYELEIHLERHEWETGLNGEVSLNSLEGLGLGARYRGRQLFMEDDRWEAFAKVAGVLRDRLEGDGTRLFLARATLESRYHTPSIIRSVLGSFLWLRADLLNRQRVDLGLEGSFYAPLEASLNLELEILRLASLSFGGGIEHRTIFGSDPTGTVSPLVEATPNSQVRPFAVLAIDFVFNQDEIRLDRKHELWLEGRLYAGALGGRKETKKLFLRHQKMWLMGFHELWVRTKSAVMTGDILYPDEEGVGGEYVRGPFSGRYFARRIASLSLEFRFALRRDLFKISAFHDLAAYGGFDARREREKVSLADSFGLGLHVLILDSFQLDTYYGFGFATQGHFDHGVVIALRQAY